MPRIFHLHKVGAICSKERKPCFTSNSFSQQCFTSTRRPMKKHTFWAIYALVLEGLIILQYAYNLLQFPLDVLLTSKIIKCDTCSLFCRYEFCPDKWTRTPVKIKNLASSRLTLFEKVNFCAYETSSPLYTRISNLRLKDTQNKSTFLNHDTPNKTHLLELWS